jgi:hypothetical protein
MPHHADRPTKTCACCGRPFQWRRKWKDVWAEVRYCSDRCRNLARRPGQRRRDSPSDPTSPATDDRR